MLTKNQISYFDIKNLNLNFVSSNNNVKLVKDFMEV
jgi:hypothetical protein